MLGNFEQLENFTTFADDPFPILDDELISDDFYPAIFELAALRDAIRPE